MNKTYATIKVGLQKYSGLAKIKEVINKQRHLRVTHMRYDTNNPKEVNGEILDRVGAIYKIFKNAGISSATVNHDPGKTITLSDVYLIDGAREAEMDGVIDKITELFAIVDCKSSTRFV